MSTPLDWLDHGLVFVLVAVRLSGFFLIAPLFGDRAVSWRVRLAMTLLVAALIAPLQVGGGDISWAAFGPLMLRESMLGVTLGFGVLLLLSAARWAGSWMAVSAGLPEAAPEHDEPLGLTRWMDLTATAVFLSVGGHRVVLGGLLASFDSLPAGEAAAHLELGVHLGRMLSLSFAVAARAAAPVLLTMLLAQWAVGVAARGSQVWNNWSIGMALQIGVLFGVLLLAAPLAAWAATDPIPEVVDWWQAVWRFGAHPLSQSPSRRSQSCDAC